ncbi:myo-inositol-1(or 4)-monophosphatase/deoxyribonuclease-2 [Propionibacterium cyclohexanicum]|uniref:Myo-inositol-1(Or 4)-monophosphatase/deoxyribonuclease-2 n=1 Tax=Propionibacterium cyclohexanicum TaxID=64702 RepID=A0A1H9QDZ7_9ACTN|nr:inositol monophosphatase family protein [Propionibacterium cyclohexanicum]SER58761.1 myo-inositol-1(or 4)-monophosphatase/deoxyribonuclease-2 [Propionibacterium cyclohexanicum]
MNELNTKTTPRPRLVAHRGASQLRPENTLAALVEAARLRADMIEVDVRLTADKIPVLLHDPTLERLWNHPHAVSKTSWQMVSTLRHESEKIPALADALRALAGSGCTLLIDLDEEECASVACEQVLSLGFETPVEWCGTQPAMARVRALDPSARIWCPWARLDVPTFGDLGALRPTTLNVDAAFLTPEIVAAAHALHLQVACWTLDEPQAARWAAQLGVDSITTNALPLLQRVLWDQDTREELAAGTRAAPEPDEDEVAEQAIVLARRIATEVMAFTRQQQIGVVARKAHGADLVTDVDRAIEREVRRVVRQHFPEHGFHGEEYGTAPGNAYTWHLDPVDGTTNLVNKVPWTSMSLCLEHEGTPLVGVVADPWRQETFEARHGHGARCDGHAMRAGAAQGCTSLAGTTVGTELDAHRPWQGMITFMTSLADRMCTMRIMGSGTLTLAQVAAGRSAGACVSGFHAIDHGAAVLLVHEAGGVVATPSGPISGFPEHAEPVLVSAPEVFSELFELWHTSLATAQ